MKIKRISLSKVLKLELPELINDVIRIIEKHNPAHLYLERSLNRLKEQQQLTKLLEVPRKAHPLTAELQLLREKELQCVGAIVSHMEFIVRADIDSMRDAATVAKPVVQRFLSGLRENNESVINQIIKQFLDHLNKYPEVENALNNLGLQPFVDELRKVNSEKLKLMSMRITNPKPRVNSRHIQKKVQNNLSIVFDSIDVLNGYEKKTKYDPLINELNQLLTRYATIIHTRKTHNKKRATKKAERKTASTKEHTSQEKITHEDTTHILLPNLIEALKLRNLNKT